MPGKLKVYIASARHLPVMDRASELTDAFVEVKFNGITYKTDVCKKSLNPDWFTWFKFEVEDEDLQNEPLQVRVMDHDTYSAHDAIGKLYLDLNPLLVENSSANILNGWLPIYDTMHGVRGEIKLSVVLELFSDANRFRASSCGVRFYGSAAVPATHGLVELCGFVEELAVFDDPEYQWIDRVRTQRSSNEARQQLFSKLSGELQRTIGLRAIQLGANSVIGYQQNFDLEGETGLVVRAIGTAANLFKLPAHRDTADTLNISNNADCVLEPSELQQGQSLEDKSRTHSVCVSSVGLMKPTPMYGSLPPRPDLSDYPFLTLTSFPVGLLLHLGGVVSARSVKLLSRIHNPEEPETRDAWWTQLRVEVRGHAAAMGCHALLGYRESTTICDELIILSATGTAAVINTELLLETQETLGCSPSSQIDRRESLNDNPPSCNFFHIPYAESPLPFPVTLATCGHCRAAKVPDILLATVDQPSNSPVAKVTMGCGFIQARVSRSLRRLQGESNAAQVSDILPFLEYELHKQLLSKLRVRGMNAVFGLSTELSVGAVCVHLVATGTATRAHALPMPGGRPAAMSECSAFPGVIANSLSSNDSYQCGFQPEANPLESGAGQLDLSLGCRQSFVLEVNDMEPTGESLLCDVAPPSGVYASTMQGLPGLTLGPLSTDMICTVCSTVNSKVDIDMVYDSMMQSLYLKLTTNKSNSSLLIHGINFRTLFVDDDEIQINLITSVSEAVETVFEADGSILEDSTAVVQDKKMTNGAVSLDEVISDNFLRNPSDLSTDDCIFQLEGFEDDPLTISALKHNFQPSTLPNVVVTPLYIIPMATIVHYLGYINLFVIRETTNIRECGGLIGLAHSFVNEALSLARAQVQALGGNALISFRIHEINITDSMGKNQGQCLLNLSGDAVLYTHLERPRSVTTYSNSYE